MGPLTGYRVVELSTFVAAPSCARLLGDWGADVIKVEPLGGDVYRYVGAAQGIPMEPGYCPSFDNENANKRFLALNLKAPEGAAALQKLLEKTDVLITNYRPEAQKKLGLDYEALRERFPRLVYASILGYGSQGPEKDRPGYDFTSFYARGGLIADLSHKDSPPLNPVSGFGDHLAGLNLAAGILAALLQRNATGRGDKVEVGLYQTAVYSVGIPLLSAYFGREYPTKRTGRATPLVGSYPCQDGEWIFVSGTVYEQQWGPFCREVLGMPELAEDPLFWPRANAEKNSEAVTARMDEIFAARPAKEWAERLKKADIAHEILFHWKDILTDEQAWANDYLRKAAYPNGKAAVFANTPITLGSLPEKPFALSGPVGRDTAQILEELGYTPAEIQTMAEGKKVKA